MNELERHIKIVKRGPNCHNLYFLDFINISITISLLMYVIVKKMNFGLKIHFFSYSFENFTEMAAVTLKIYIESIKGLIMTIIKR